MTRKICQEGQSLWEVVIAVAITALVALGLVRTGTYSVKSSKFASDQSRFTALAQESLVQAVDQRTTDPVSFWSSFGAVVTDNPAEGYCLKRKTEDKTGDLPGDVQANGGKMALISVDIFWDEKGSGSQCASKDFSHNLQLDTYVTN